jgi:SHAQKYF class myb-like DNA-binding protein
MTDDMPLQKPLHTYEDDGSEDDGVMDEYLEDKDDCDFMTQQSHT